MTGLAFPDRLAQARPGSRGAYRLANGRGAVLDGSDPLAAAPWLAVAEVEDVGAEARIRLASSLALEQIEALHGDRFVAEDEIRFDPRDEAVVARRIVRLGALVLKEQPLAVADPSRIAEACALPWSRAGPTGCHGPEPHASSRHGWRWSAARPRTAWPDFGRCGPAGGLEDWLGPHLSGMRRLAIWPDFDLPDILLGLLDHAQRRELDRLAPPHLGVCPAAAQPRSIIRVDPPVLAVKLQELFGLTRTPAIKGGRTQVTLQLLSPAQRPMAVTQDLAGFWATGYPAVRKELRGRYPKHPWPEEPTAAPPTHRTRKAARRCASLVVRGAEHALEDQVDLGQMVVEVEHGGQPRLGRGGR